MKRFIALIFPLLCSLAVAAQTPGIEITDLRVTQLIPGQSTIGGYFTLTNHSQEVVVLESVEADFAARVEMHETMNMNGMMHMHPVELVRVEPGQTLAFSPGGKHLMIMGVDSARLQSAAPGLTFHFAGDQTLSVTAEIVQR